ncbi:hypothetical protein [Aquiflexum lacus]|uniref:hypothetical protein n=1 Tax=Aquiflexum lacus TaxID=2483805 RepID=UPI001895730C|nr:hypothetical protein [Aquiflexum lacus]
MRRELIIKIDNKEVHLSPTLAIPIGETNIPIEHFKFRSHNEIYWNVELIEYNHDTRCWKMKVLDYFIKHTESFEGQKYAEQIDRIAFEKFDWLNFEQLLTSYSKINLISILDNHDVDRFYRESAKQSKKDDYHQLDFHQQKKDDHDFMEDDDLDPNFYSLNFEFKVDFSDAEFKDGYVTFTKKITKIPENVEFNVKNEFLLAEFESIKSWFSKKLKTKKFRVNAIIKISYGKVFETTATSPEISKIDAELVDSIKYDRTIALTKEPNSFDRDKSLFTLDEIFGEIKSNDVEGNVFKQSDDDILGLLLKNHKTRNKKQLEYLAGRKQSENSKLKFTLHPNFGFLFLIEGKENNHFVWELLNSHATYIWSIEKSELDIELQFKRIEASINTIRDGGRELYKKAYRNKDIDNDLGFSTIDHDDISLNFAEGFIKWKHKLKEGII